MENTPQELQGTTTLKHLEALNNTVILLQVSIEEVLKPDIKKQNAKIEKLLSKDIDRDVAYEKLESRVS